ncbi:MAG: mechanosensitive ion channel family protein [Gudongella sp.]|nr:mechanosensitive ion channel family protein [Gudongella sp.]
METIMKSVEAYTGIPESIQGQLFRSILILILVIILHQIIKRVLYKTIQDRKTYYRFKKGVGYAFIIIGFVLIARVWFKGVTSLTTFIGLFSAGLAIALKDIIMNIAGWFYIVWKGSFRVGDRIEIDGTAGDVIGIQLFEFTMMEIGNWVPADQSTGRITYVPNYLVFKEPVFNYSSGIPFVWQEIPIYLTFESNWKKAKSILEEIALKHGETIEGAAEESMADMSRKFMIYNAKLEPKVYTSINHEDGIRLTIRYMCAYRNRRDSAEEVYEEVLNRFEDHKDIEFAYPTQRVYERPREKNES